ncbi:hypothetical protein BC829DRAFT_270037 [Chytridium lagenaria]|nr:hypothetical protein BC829DRAFT_270037 [Chytridium lagenaria]
MMMMPMHMPMPWGYGPPNSSPGVGGYGGIGHKVPPEIGPPYFPPSPHPAYSAWLAAMAAGNSEAAATAAAFYGSPEGMGVGVDGAGPPGFFPPHFGYVGSWNHVGGGMSERAMADREMDERAMRNMKVGMERQGGTVNSDGSEEGEGDEKDVEDLLDPTESPERADFQEHTPAGGLGMLWGPPDLRRLETAKKAGLSVLTRMNGGVGENREVPLSPAVASPHVEQPEDNHVAMLEGLQAADDGRVENSGGDEVDSSGKGQRRDSGMEQPRSPRRSSRLEQEVPPSGPIRVGSRLRPASRNVHSFYASGGVFKQPPPVVSASPASQPLRRTRSTTDAVLSRKY